MAALTAAPVCARAAVLTVGGTRALSTLAAAATLARAGDTIRLDPGHYGECAALETDRLTLEGAGDRPQAVVLSGALCEGKAILVTRGTGMVLRNLTLADAASPDGNGAGVRDESADLLIERVVFRHDQDGILTGASADAVLTVRNSVFEHDGACEQACAHAIYAGHIARLVVDASRFYDTRVGHHIKSRARRTEIIDCRIEDGADGTASYLIDIPEGGGLLVRGTRMQKGPHSGNPRAAIILGEEGVRQSGAIRVEDNWFSNDTGGATLFVDNRTPDPATLTDNRLEGRVRLLPGGR